MWRKSGKGVLIFGCACVRRGYCTVQMHHVSTQYLILRIISSPLTLFSNSLCSLSDTCSSFLSSVIRLSFSWDSAFKLLWDSMKSRPTRLNNLKTWRDKSVYPCYSIRLSLERSKNWTICFLLKLMYLCFHICLRLNSSIQRSANSISSISSGASTAFHASAVLIWWWKIIIGSCNQCQISEYSISNVVTWLVQTGG